MSETGTVLVCVTDQMNCGRLIRYGRKRADEIGCPLRVLHVRTREKTMMGNPDISSALNDLYRLSREADAEMEIISSPEVEKTICAYAADAHADALVIGCSPADARPSMSERLALLLPETEICVV